MLRISIPSNGQSNLTFSGLGNYNIPTPVGGFEAGFNDTVVMQFENEQQAIDYAYNVDVYADDINYHSSPEYLVVYDIIKAISDDKFVQAYIHD